ncbi:hypothetical protein T11_16780 [Trichinella zimbabwensis]|uniref:Uncharacterized protein n=1 Tax=Trichinella zimbabwensis TaxID=268475 RepID=A0A0V1HG50_9BILA|nr:hypothetical protein T11_16780 [Trichinella zimbabwensis]
MTTMTSTEPDGEKGKSNHLDTYLAAYTHPLLNSLCRFSTNLLTIFIVNCQSLRMIADKHDCPNRKWNIFTHFCHHFQEFPFIQTAPLSSSLLALLLLIAAKQLALIRLHSSKVANQKS